MLGFESKQHVGCEDVVEEVLGEVVSVNTSIGMCVAKRSKMSSQVTITEASRIQRTGVRSCDGETCVEL